MLRNPDGSILLTKQEAEDLWYTHALVDEVLDESEYMQHVDRQKFIDALAEARALREQLWQTIHSREG